MILRIFHINILMMTIKLWKRKFYQKMTNILLMKKFFHHDENNYVNNSSKNELNLPNNNDNSLDLISNASSINSP